MFDPSEFRAESSIPLSESLQKETQRIKWIEDHDYIVCPACGARYNDEILYFAKMKYCPQCGTKIE